MAQNILDLSLADFRATIDEMQANGSNTDEIVRQYRAKNSVFSPINNAADAYQRDLAGAGRRPVLGGLLSKEIGTTGMDALRSIDFEGMGGLLGMGKAIGQTLDAPAAAAQGLIPQADMSAEALGTAGLAMGAGGAVTSPGGALRSNALRGGGRSDPTQTGWTFRDVDASLNSQLSRDENNRIGGDTSRVENVPIRRLNAMQETVNPDFARTASSAGELPLVVRKNGKMFVRDGHHRLTAMAEGGSQNANVRFIDLDNADTSTPLLDWSPEKTGFVEADQMLLDQLFSNSSASGGLLGAGLSEAQRVARDVLEMRAAGRAGEVTDDMMARADPQYMYDNTPLPMDEASRLSRAQAGGFDTNAPVYHGGDGGIVSMDPDMSGGKDYDTGAWTTSDPYNANRYAGSRTEGVAKNPDDLGAVYPMYADKTGYGVTDFRGQNWGDAPAGATIRGGGKPSQPISKIREDWQSWPYSAEAVRAARDTGRTGLQIKNVSDIGSQFPHPSLAGLGDEVADTVVAIDPSTLRSRFARFDPEFAHLSNLSAANASPTAGLLASGAQEQGKPLPFMELLRGLLR
jgi:hypothetical protein